MNHKSKRLQSSVPKPHQPSVVDIPESSAIVTFHMSPSEAPGFMHSWTINLKSLMTEKTSHDLDSLSLGKPAVCEQHTLVGTDDPTSKYHYLIYLNGHFENLHADPLISYIQVNDVSGVLQNNVVQSIYAHDRVTFLHAFTSLQHIRDIKWITPSTILAAVGSGHLSLFNKSSETGALSFEGNLPSAHVEPIREMAQKPDHPVELVTGGFDQTLAFVNLDHPAVTQQQFNTSHVIGSVKWPIWNARVCPSVTLDSGSYIMYDVRQSPGTAAFRFDSQIPDLYTHERYTDFNVLLGYQGGCIKNIDMRRGGIDQCVISTEKDPWCCGIGGIDYNYDKHTFVTSGLTDFTVWKQSVTNEVKLWSHGYLGINSLCNEDGYTVLASWFDSNTLVAATSSGTVGVYVQHLF